MAKHRGRKTTNSLFTTPNVQGNCETYLKSTTSYLHQKLTVTRGAAAAGTFTVKLAGGDTVQAIAHDANAATVQTQLAALESVNDVECAGGELGNKPVRIQFRDFAPASFNGAPSKPPLLQLDAAGLVDAQVKVEKLNVQEIEWRWAKDTFKDANSGRIVMEVDEMSLVVTSRGKWRLRYKPRVYARRHKWVYKLQAFDAEDRRLFHLVMRPFGRVPETFGDVPPTGSQPDENIQTGRFNAAAIHFDHIIYWARCGVGEYHD